MANPSGSNSERIRVGGIKISPELVQVIYTRPSSVECRLHPALEILVSHNINISYLTLSTAENSVITSFCITTDTASTVQGILQDNDQLSGCIEIVPSVGSLTLFPHRNSFSMLGRVLKLFGRYNLNVYGICTSISTISILIDFSLLEHAINVLEEIIELPDNHSPFRQEFQIRQVGQ